jgi:hypothetical protein
MRSGGSVALIRQGINAEMAKTGARLLAVPENWLFF